MANLKLKGISIDNKPRKDGRWQARYSIDGKQYSVYGKTQEIAKQKAIKFYNAKKPPKPKTKAKSYTYNQWLDEWMELYKKPVLKPNSIDSLERCIKNYIKPFFKEMQLKEITTNDLQKCINKIELPRPKEIAGNIISDSLRKAFVSRLIKYNPAEAIIKFKAQSKHKRALTISEQKKLLEHIQGNEFELLINTYIFTGLRRAEALALKWKDIDFEKNIISVKFQKDIKGNLVTPKSKKSVRIVPLLPPLKKLMLKQKRKSDNFLFNYKLDFVSRTVKAIMIEINIHDIDVHSLRHTFATRCAEQKVPDKVIQKWLGHAEVSTTQNIYEHIQDEFENQEINNLINAFDTNSKNFDTKK